MTRRRTDRGFTLIEVIVALAILSIAVVASIQGFAQGLRLLKAAGDHQRATLYADQKLREVVVPKEGREEEEDRDAGFTWERVTTAVPTPELTADGTRDAPLKEWQIVVRVRWGERGHVEIATLRTIPNAEDNTIITVPGQPTTPGTTTGTTTPGSTRSPGLLGPGQSRTSRSLSLPPSVFSTPGGR